MKLATRLTLAMGLVVLITGGVNAYLNYRSLESGTVPVEIERMRLDLAQFANLLESRVSNNRSELLAQRWSAQVLELQRLNSGPASGDSALFDNGWRENLASNFHAILRSHPEILQFRLIGTARDGREVVRVERDALRGSIRIVPEAELQAKDHRDYYAAVSVLADNTAYVSQIDLNREHGRIERPPVPVMRLATPVRTDSGRLLAMLTINVDMRTWFDAIRKQGGGTGQIYVVNANGDYLLHPDPSVEFGFEFDQHRRIGDDFPHLAGWLGSAVTDARVRRDSQGEDLGVAMVPIKLADGPWLGLVKQVPYAELISPVKSVLRSSLFAVVISFAIAILLAGFVSGRLTAALSALVEAVAHYRGKSAIRLPARTRVTEFDTLAKAFETMSAVLEENITRRERLTEQFERVVEHSPSGSLMVDESGRITFVNPRAASMFGYAREDMFEMQVEALIPERFRGNHEGLRKGFLWQREPRLMGAGRDLYALRADGSEFPVEIALTPVETDSGAMILATVNDITERKQSEAALRDSLEEKEVLLKEVYHRVKNNLEIISSLLSLQEMQVPDGEAREALRDSSARVKSMSLVHNMLSQNEQYTRIDIRQYMDSLIREFRSAHGRIARQIEVEAVIDEASLSIGTTIPLGLLVNELMSNAFRYAFPDGRPGRLKISLRRDQQEFVLSVADDGIGVAEDFDISLSESLGFTLVRALTRQLDGTVEVERRDGTLVTVHFRGD
jgi:PAS domain S-box-containing protein